MVLNGVDMEVRAGEIVTMVGPNGAGKTTLVRALLALQPASTGSVSRRPGLRVGYMPQRFQVDIALPITAGRLLRMASKANLAQIEQLIQEVRQNEQTDQHNADRIVEALERLADRLQSEEDSDSADPLD